MESEALHGQDVTNIGPLQAERIGEGKPVDHAPEAVDWLGRPIIGIRGGPITSIFILGNQGLWNVANYGVGTSLVLYMTMVLQKSSATAANNVTNWFGTIWLTTLLGGFLGDSYWGRFWTCIVFQIVHLLGMALISLSVTLKSLKISSCPYGRASCPEPSSERENFFFFSLYVIALGTGGYLPAFQALGADQYNTEAQKTRFFGWLFVFNNVGAIVANTFFVYLENQGRWALAYWLSTAAGGLAFVLFFMGVSTYRQYRPAGNPFVRAAQVLVAATRKWHVEASSDSNSLHEVSEDLLLVKGSRKTVHTNKFRFLDKAATKTSESDMTGNRVNPWRLCPVTQVEEVKSVCRLVPIWLCGIFISAIFSQINTLFIEQSVTMDTHIGHFHMPPASISVVNILSIFFWTVAYFALVVPFARKLTGNPTGFTQLQRMAMGQVITMVAMVIAALVEMKRLRVVRRSGVLNAPAFTPVPMSVFWLVPQFFVLGAAQVFGVVGAMDFFYSEAPHSIRSMVGALSLANLAIGSYTSSLLVTLVMHITTRGGKSGWIPRNLNHGHVDYFYWLLAGFTAFNLFLFVICAHGYKYKAKVFDEFTEPSPPPSARL